MEQGLALNSGASATAAASVAVRAEAAAELLRRARQRCAQHRGPTHGICRECYQAEMEQMLLEPNPGTCRGSAFELVQEWARAPEGLNQ